MNDLLNALFHAVVYALVGGAMLVAAYYVLDLATPGHLGTHLRGVDENGMESVHAPALRRPGHVRLAGLQRRGAVHRDLDQRRDLARLGARLDRGLRRAGHRPQHVMFFAVEAITPGQPAHDRAPPDRCARSPTSPPPALSVGAIVCASIA